MSVPRVGIDRGNHPVGGHPLSYPRGSGSVGVDCGLDVLARRDPQHLDRRPQARIIETGAEPHHGVGVAEQLRHQRCALPRIGPHDLRLRFAAIVLERQQRSKLGARARIERAEGLEALADPDLISVIVSWVSTESATPVESIVRRCPITPARLAAILTRSPKTDSIPAQISRARNSTSTT